MQRIYGHLCICALLLGGMSTLASAGTILASVDLTKHALPVTLTVRNAEMTDVLYELFAATDKRCTLRIGLGIRGTIDHLQLDAQPFDQALHAVLAQANADYSFTKQGDGVYRVFTTQAVAVSVPVVRLPDVQALGDMQIIKALLPPLDKKDEIGGNATSAPATSRGAATPASPAMPGFPGMSQFPAASPYPGLSSYPGQSPYPGFNPYYGGSPTPLGYYGPQVGTVRATTPGATGTMLR
jgi:hypothetical protein